MSELPPTPTPFIQSIPPIEVSLTIRPDIMQRLDFSALFNRSGPVELELGAGDGSFILQYAERHPETCFLAVERLLGRLRKIDRKGRRLELRNLRSIRLEAAYLLEWMIPPTSLQAIHVYFPDPWPKRRHAKNRLIQNHFPSLCAAALISNGTVHVRTDDAPYFQQIQEVFNTDDAQRLFELVETSPDLLGVRTDFETVFHQEGKTTLHASWRRKEPVQRG
jgi:tRNA (guanine-N7-)-methyltransferase